MLSIFGNLDPDNPISKMIFIALGNDKNYIDIIQENIDDHEIVKLIRYGFKISYNGMFGVYRIEWK
jgi:hypothetical protein